MDPFINENLITAKDAGKLSGYTSDYLARLARSGKISGKVIGHSWFIKRESLIRFLDQQGNRKTDYKRKLARTRRIEYRVHRSIFTPVSAPSTKHGTLSSVPIRRPVARFDLAR